MYRFISLIFLFFSGFSCAYVYAQNMMPLDLTQQKQKGEFRIQVASTRQYAVTKDHSSGWFTGKRGTGLIFGELILEPPEKSLIRSWLFLDQKQWQISSLFVPELQYASSNFIEATYGHDVLLYVHGFRETFESAALSAFQLSNSIDFKGKTALFTWPSSGSTLDYGYDRESAYWSREYFSQLLKSLESSKSGGKVHIVAHSMGTLLTLEALRDVLLQNGKAPLHRIASITLAAPDVDMDIFQQEIERLGSEAKKITVISSANDRALALSSILSGGERAGKVDREQLEKLGVRVADATEFARGLLNHDLFLTNTDVIQVVRRTIDRSK